MTIDVYKVDKDVPIPEDKPVGLPLDGLEVGESIQFPTDDRTKVQIQASRLKRRTGKDFTVRKENDDNTRIWRTA